MKVVLDTNVLVSATFWTGEASKVIELIENKSIQCFISKEILQEYVEVLHSDEIVQKMSKNNLTIKSTVIKLLQITIIVEPHIRLDIVKNDPDDNKILECALEAKADYIITYDSAHLLKLKNFHSIKIVSPTEFIKMFK